MMKQIVLMILFISSSSYANEKVALKNFTSKYLLSIMNKDQKTYQSLVTKKFLSSQRKEGFVKRVFSGKVKKKKKNLDFDFKFRKAAVTKNQYFINFKEKNKKDYDDGWLVVIKDPKTDEIKLDEIRHIED